ncbi:hypothetical protein ACRE_089840 [Hapsidospora chrysogenum ATCC 11550]|uniref:Uncharacterized protein n=1 Tax=Hapsidospora chrysogenum (strain ATCC 11550 / CBS 779.69 / DSM 880 / IAM 14645 / JCM 23072 / IMI 49137) TaxID=857340 RepID=A0A086STB9_HAPC1|nr:hypothetical protein ACRE_089840 [Hapsidospora chrysogenum ATCC 11550]
MTSTYQCVEVDVLGGDAATLGDEHVAKDEHEVQGNAKVASDKGGIVEGLAVPDEDGEVLGEGNQAAEEERNAAPPRAQGRTVGQFAVGNVLHTASLDEVDVRDEDGDPGQKAKDGGQVDKVLEDGASVVGDVHEGQARNGGAQEEGGVRHAATVGAPEDGGSRSVAGKAVERTAGNIQVRVGGGEDEDEDAAINQARQALDSGQLGGDDERRGAGASVLLVGEGEFVRVVGNDEADEEDAQDVEEEDAVEGELDGLGDTAPGVLCLPGRHTDELRAEECESSIDHDAPETHKLGQRRENGNEDTWIHSFRTYPFLDDEGGGGCHLAESGHDHVDDGAHEGIRDEERPGTSIGEGGASSDNEASSQSTADGNHGDMASLEASVE